MLVRPFKFFKLSQMLPKIIGSLMILHGIGNVLMGASSLFHIQALEEIEQSTQTAYQEVTQITIFSQIESLGALVSIFLGIAIVYLGLGLFKRKHAAWLWALLVQIIIFISSCFPHFSFQMMLISIIYMALLYFSRKEFYVHNTQQQGIDIFIAWTSIFIALTYGILGSYLMRDQFHGIHTLVDAFYYTIETYSTVGYGDILPITQNAKMFSASMIILGITSFITTLTLVIGPMVQQRVRGVYRIMSKLDNFNNHIVISGFNELTRICAKNLITQGSQVLFLEKDQIIADQIKSSGFNVVMGDPTHPAELASSNIIQANVLICGQADDAQNILILMAAHEAQALRKHPKDFKIICRIEESHNIEKAKKLGATSIISPSILGGEMMAKAVL